MGSWVHTWSSAPAEHSGQPVSALSWQATLPSFGEGGDAHAGWLFSAARGALNLWECSPSHGVGGEAALTLMHAQSLPFRATLLEVDSHCQLLLAGAADARSGLERAAVTVHSLSPADFMGMGGAIKPAAPLGGAAPPPGTPLLAASLSACGGPLAGSVAIAYGKEVSVMALPRAGAAPAAATKAHWRALAGGAAALHISAVAPWPAAPLVLTGGSDGSVAVWDVRMRPAGAAAAPAAAVPRAGAGGVVHLSVPAATVALSVTEGGDCALWDLRSLGGAAGGAAKPGDPGWRIQLAQSASVGGEGPLKAAALAGSTCDSLAVVSGGAFGDPQRNTRPQPCGLYAAVLQPSGASAGFGPFGKLAFPSAAAAPRQPAAPGYGGGALAWGRYGSVLYAGGTDGSIAAFRA